MRTRWLSILAAAVAVLLPLGAVADVLDAPHDGSGTNGDCNLCHDLVGSNGGTNFTSRCQACHATKAGHGFPWLDTDQAAPGVGGNHHSWSGQAENATYGASLPQSPSAMARLDDGKLQCTVCHNPHSASEALAPNSQNTSIPVGTAVARTAGTGSATMTLVTSGSVAKGYRVKIQAGGTSFVISHDYQLASPSWFNWNGSAWVIGTDTGPGRAFTPGTAVALDDPAVTVRFTAGAVAGDYWDFRITYPFMRLAAVDDIACYNCHRSRVMKHTRVGGFDGAYPANGTNLFSHPVEQPLNANGKGLDATPASMLDVNGLPQGTGDAKASNNLVLYGASQVVRCTTCHAVHNADSNSISDDPR